MHATGVPVPCRKNALIQLMFLEFLLRMVLLLSNNNLTMQTLLQNLLHQM
jgi:hypothetical protein